MTNCNRSVRDQQAAVQVQIEGIHNLMKLQRIVCVLAVAILFMSVRVFSQGGKSAKSPSSPAAQSVEAFLGRWDLTLKAPHREYPSSLSLPQHYRSLHAPMI